MSAPKVLSTVARLLNERLEYIEETGDGFEACVDNVLSAIDLTHLESKKLINSVDNCKRGGDAYLRAHV